MSDTEINVYEGWAILELMGHRRLAGYVSEVEFAGGKFVRLDVPAGGSDASTGPGRPSLDDVHVTQLYGASSVYCLTPTTEKIARAVAERSTEAAPVSRWELRALEPAKPAAADVDEDEIDDADLVDDTY